MTGWKSAGWVPIKAVISQDKESGNDQDMTGWKWGGWAASWMHISYVTHYHLQVGMWLTITCRWARDSRKIRDSWRAIGYLSKQWSGDPSRRGFLRLIRTSGVQWSGRRRAGNSCISRGPKSSLEKPDFSHLNNEHKAPRPQPLFFIYSLVIHTHPFLHETALHHSTASRLPPLSTLHHITVPRLLFLQHYHIIVSRLLLRKQTVIGCIN